METSGVLPVRDDAAEEAFVGRWRDGAGSEEDLIAACAAAVEARRWMLAARLVSLLPERDDEHPEITRARAAARMVVLRRLRPEDVSWSALTSLWAHRNHHRRMSRNRDRWRARQGGPSRRGGGRR